MTLSRTAAGVLAGVVLTGTASDATGGSFILGRSNSASTTTTLTSGSGAPLKLVAPAGSAPLAVNSGKRVANLNAGKLDGLSAEQMQRTVTTVLVSGDLVDRIGEAVCPAGLVPISGGVAAFDATTKEFGSVSASFAGFSDDADSIPDEWFAAVVPSTLSPDYTGTGTVWAQCANVGLVRDQTLSAPAAGPALGTTVSQQEALAARTRAAWAAARR